MHRSAENKLIGKTMGDLAKQNAPSVNKSALKIIRLEYISLNARYPTISAHTVLTSFLPTVSTHKLQLLFRRA